MPHAIVGAAVVIRAPADDHAVLDLADFHAGGLEGGGEALEQIHVVLAQVGHVPQHGFAFRKGGGHHQQEDLVAHAGMVVGGEALAEQFRRAHAQQPQAFAVALAAAHHLDISAHAPQGRDETGPRRIEGHVLQGHVRTLDEGGRQAIGRGQGDVGGNGVGLRLELGARAQADAGQGLGLAGGAHLARDAAGQFVAFGRFVLFHLDGPAELGRQGFQPIGAGLGKGQVQGLAGGQMEGKQGELGLVFVPTEIRGLAGGRRGGGSRRTQLRCGLMGESDGRGKQDEEVIRIRAGAQ